MSRFQASWTLLKRSLQVIGGNKKLLLFPVVTSFLTVLIALFFIAPIALAGSGHPYTDAAHWKAVANSWVIWNPDGQEVYLKPAAYGLIAGLYLLSMFLTTFFNVAFFHEILNALNGRAVSIPAGFKFAFTRLKAILAWSLLTGLVGLAIKALEERMGFVGRWVMKLIGIAWSVASVFVVPIIIREENRATPVLFLKSSASMLRKTWGESLLGYLGVRLGGLVILLASVVLLGVGSLAAYLLQSGWLLGITFAVWLFSLILAAYVLHVASQVYLGALFIYASEGVVPGPFDQEQMDMAWKVKSGRKGR